MHRRFYSIDLVAAAGFLLGSLAVTTHAASGPLDFNRDVGPILSDRCYACHGPDSQKREAGLRLDTFEGATAPLKSGVRAIVPGNTNASALVSRIHTTDPDDQMPPSKLNRPLTTGEKETLVRWIVEGAPYSKHWAFRAAERHPVPQVKNQDWPKNGIDRFVLAKLEALKLSPNPEADRGALLRRASFALTGLPPSAEQLAAFAADRSDQAWEKQVDALLASPRYGERMASDWLDVARFADTMGYQGDPNGFVWPWRDWVIRAFNDNLPYDQFLTWQIAGDLLPDATQDQQLATMFNRLHRQTNEGGSIEQEFRQEYVSDRVHTAGTAFLGLTLECSKCHDHKYDPLPQADYYSLSAMFGQIDECGLYPYGINTTAAEPSMRLLEPGQAAEAKKREAALKAARAKAAAIRTERAEAFAAWLTSAAELSLPAPSDHFPLDAIVEGKLTNGVAGAASATMSAGVLAPVPGVVQGAMKFDGDTVLQLNGVKGITRHDSLSVSVRLFCPEKKDRAVLLHTGPAMYACASDAAGFELLLENGKLRWSCIHLWPGCAASVEMTEDFPIQQWVDVTVTYDGTSRAAGLKIYRDGKVASTVVLHDHLDKSIFTEMMRVGARPRDDRGFAGGLMDEIRIFRQPLSALEVAHLHAPAFAETLAQAKTGDRVAQALLREHFLNRVDEPCAAARRQVSAALKHLEDEYLHRMPLIMTMKESPNPKQFYVLQRGDYASPDLKRPVLAAAPSDIMPFRAEDGRNRLGLARWMTDPNNPLVARVAVNRLWMQCFGTGIVLTQENFGTQGDPPSHPELLDTLAYEFSHTGWDTKRLLKQIMMSATFRQSSASTPEKKERDPGNRFLSRGPSYRLSGEAIRDQALFASGLLVDRMGGPSAKPWQPPGLWSEAGASGGDYTPDTGAGLYRRSLYTFRKRTAPPPSMTTLDGGSRETCQPRRLTTNTPLQPLLFLNDKAYFECARELARRVRRDQPGGLEPQLERAFLLLTSRPPAAPEMKSLRALYEQQLATYATDLPGAKAVCGQEDPGFASMTIVCSTLLVSDAALTNR
jgi:hypothetical protein